MILFFCLLALSSSDALTIGTGWILTFFGLLTAFATALGIFWAKFGTEILAVQAHLKRNDTRLDQHRAELSTLNLNATPPAGGAGAAGTAALQENTEATNLNTAAQVATGSGGPVKSPLADKSMG